jgi:hypothetical protein
MESCVRPHIVVRAQERWARVHNQGFASKVGYRIHIEMVMSQHGSAPTHLLFWTDVFLVEWNQGCIARTAGCVAYG